MDETVGDAELLARATALAGRWQVRLGEPYERGWGGRVYRAWTPDGVPAALKVSVADREGALQSAALATLDGRGAVRLLASTPDGAGMLLERCEPGHPLSSAGGQVALDVLVGLLPRTWVSTDRPFTTLRDEAAHWFDQLEPMWERTGRGVDRRLVDAAAELLRWLPGSQGPQVLVNQDLHGDNVLAAEREPWLVIDPLPLVGEREFAVAPIVRSAELGHSARDVRYRLDRLVGELGLDADRARGWSIVQTIAWCTEDGAVLPGHIDVATWLLDRLP
ncbi:aminoglycoside phosphotransferase family protein [Angustibacter luteus]|uniref:Aminoglycoside phosphotransferase family protein n=1 Tax=Angustibacter luteus TaxID=658456 RepID=A0ABW1JD88_9ACTN